MGKFQRTIAATLAVVGGLSVSHTASAAPEYPSDQTLTVKLVDARSLMPIAGAKVAVYSYVSGEVHYAQSNRRGWVKVSGLDGDEFAVKVRGTEEHCGGQLIGDPFDRWVDLDMLVSPDDGATFSARHLGVAGMKQRSSSGRC